MKAQLNFVLVFQEKKAPNSSGFTDVIMVKKPRIRLIDLMLSSGNAKSFSDARRKIEQGGVRIDGEKMTNIHFELNKKEHNRKNIKIGKFHFFQAIFD